MKTEIFVMTHKACVLPNIPGYIRMQVGSAMHDDLGYMRDDEGEDHISDLNPYYAELSGLYWLWRNYHDIDNIGLCHYRRYFINDDKKIVTMDECEELLKNADIMVAVAEREKDRIELPIYSIVHKVIEDMYPSDLPAFERSCDRAKGTFGNLFVMRRDRLDEYCEWLFSILSEASGYLDFDSLDDYEKKSLAIVSEELLGVYVDGHSLRACECKAGIFGEKQETIELKQALKYLMDQEKYVEAKELYDGVLKQRPDLILEASDLSGELVKTRAFLEQKCKEK